VGNYILSNPYYNYNTEEGYANCEFDYSIIPEVFDPFTIPPPECSTTSMSLEIFKYLPTENERFYNGSNFCPYRQHSGGLEFSSGPWWDETKGGSRCVFDAEKKYIAVLTMGVRTEYNEYQNCGLSLRWAAIIADPAVFGTDIQMPLRPDGTRLCGSADIIDTSDIPVIGGQYMDCSALNNVSLTFLGHYYWGEYCPGWSISYKWGGQPITISALY
jgi:hypothetical protein